MVIVGSGISGLTAAFTAAEAGLSPLVVEAAQAWGGSSAMPAGGVWVPVNHIAGVAGFRPAGATEDTGATV